MHAYDIKKKKASKRQIDNIQHDCEINPLENIQKPNMLFTICLDIHIKYYQPLMDKNLNI